MSFGIYAIGFAIMIGGLRGYQPFIPSGGGVIFH